MTATLELITIVAANIIGLIVCCWLSLISWERRISILSSQRVVLKKSRIRAVNKQLRLRITLSLFHFIAALLGISFMYGITIPYNGQSWIGVLIILMLVIMSTWELYREFRS